MDGGGSEIRFTRLFFGEQLVPSLHLKPFFGADLLGIDVRFLIDF